MIKTMTRALTRAPTGALVGAVLLLFAAAPWAPARAAIVLSLDPAAQSVNLADMVTVDLNVSGLGVGAAPSLGAWDVDIAFDPAILGFAGATFGTGLDLFGLGLNPSGVFDLGGTLDLFEVSLDTVADLDTLQPAAFTLATLSFDALGAGTSALGLTIDALSDSTGLIALSATAAGASVTVNAAIPVPEPGSLALFGLGLAGLALMRRRRAPARGTTESKR